MPAESRTDIAEDGVVDFAEYLRVLARRKWLVAACVLLGLLAAFAYGRSAGTTYSSTARVFVQQTFASEGSGPRDGINIQSQVSLATSTVVADLAREQLGTTRPASALLNQVNVVAPAKSEILNFTFTDNDRDSAQAGAQAFAQAYLQYRTNQATAETAEARERLLAQDKTLTAQLSTISGTLATLVRGTAEEITARNSYVNTQNQLTDVRTELQGLENRTIDPGRIITPATKPAGSSGLPLPVILLAGMLIGLVFGILLAFVRDRLDDRIRSESDLDRNVFSPVLASVADRGDVRGRLAMLDPTSGARDGYGRLLARLLVAGRRDGLNSVMLTSPVSDRDTAVVGSNLAVAMAQAGHRTVLVSAMAGDSSIGALVNRPSGPGLLDVVNGRARLQDAVVAHPRVNRLLVLPGGRDAGGGLVNFEGTRSVLEQLQSQADYIVLVTPAVLGAADSLLLASLADGVAVVVESGVTRRPDLLETQQRLEQVGARQIGSVITDVKLSRRARQSVAHRAAAGDEPRTATQPVAPGDDTNKVLQR